MEKLFADGILNSHMCFLTGPKKSPEICIVESGSPLFYSSNDTYYIHGILSFGSNKCALPLIEDVTNVFTKVGSYLDWIEETAWPRDEDVKFKN